MASQRSDVTLALSVQDNLSASIRAMQSSLTPFRDNIYKLQRELDVLSNTRYKLKMDLTQAQNELKAAQRAFDQLGQAADEAERAAAGERLQQAQNNYEHLRQQLDLVSRQARQTQRDMERLGDVARRNDNRAGSSGSSGGSGGSGGDSGDNASLLATLGKAGLLDMAGDAAQEIAGTLVTSAFGSTAGSVLSSGLSGALSGAAMGSLAGLPGIAVGAAVGGALGLLQGGTQAFEGRDDAFKEYYAGLYEQGKTAAQESLESGSATAAQRELDAIAFEQLLGAGASGRYLADLRTLAARTPLEYSDLTGMSRALATGFGDSPERMLELMQAIGDAGSAVGVTAADMEEMARAMSRMNSSGKATLEYLNIFQDRGVDAIGMLSEAMGKTQGEIYDMISKGEIGGQYAADILQAGMQERYSGAMERMATTFDGLTSTLEDTMAELDNAMGEGYNETRSEGLQAEIDTYSGVLGTAVENLNRIAGENQAYLENLGEQYLREALGAVLLGQDTTLYAPEQQEELARKRTEYLAASAEYQQTGDREAAAVMERVYQETQALATASYESSDIYQDIQGQELDTLKSIREDVKGLPAYLNSYNMQREQDKGLLATGSGSSSSTGSTSVPLGDRFSEGSILGNLFASHAYGLERVPYNGYAALLHEGERVLTASQAREKERSNPAPVAITGNTFVIRQESDVESVAERLYRKIRLAEEGGIR